MDSNQVINRTEMTSGEAEQELSNSSWQTASDEVKTAPIVILSLEIAPILLGLPCAISSPEVFLMLFALFTIAIEPFLFLLAGIMNLCYYHKAKMGEIVNHKTRTIAIIALLITISPLIAWNTPLLILIPILIMCILIIRDKNPQLSPNHLSLWGIVSIITSCAPILVLLAAFTCSAIPIKFNLLGGEPVVVVAIVYCIILALIVRGIQRKRFLNKTSPTETYPQVFT